MTSDALNDDCFAFVKAENFFGHGTWKNVVGVTDAQYDQAKRTLYLTVTTSEPNGISSAMYLQIPQYNVVRVRFEPDRASYADYPSGSPRSQANAVAIANARLDGPEQVVMGRDPATGDL